MNRRSVSGATGELNGNKGATHSFIKSKSTLIVLRSVFYFGITQQLMIYIPSETNSIGCCYNIEDDHDNHF